MNLMEREQLLQALQEQRDDVVAEWYRAIAPTGFPSIKAAEVHQCLGELLDQVLAFLFSESPDERQGRDIGLALARLCYLQPDSLGRTQTVLMAWLLDQLPGPSVDVLSRVPCLFGQLAAGFVEQKQRVVLQEQEKIQIALVESLKWSERELEKSERVVRTLLNAPNDVIVLLDIQGAILAINKVAARWLNAEPDELVGICVFDLVVPALAQLGRETIDQVLKSGQSVCFDQVFQGRYFDLCFYPIIDKLDRVVQIAVFGRDITRRKRVERALKQSEKKFRLLYEDAPLGYQALDKNGMLLEVNQTWLDLLGYDRQEQVVGRWFGEFLAAGSVECLDECLARLEREGEIHGVELEVMRRDGHRLMASFDGKLGRERRGRSKQLHCIVHDITERKRMEDALRQSQERYQAVSELTSDFAYTAWIKPDDRLVVDWVTDAFTKVTGLPLEEAVSDSGWWSSVYPEDEEILSHHIETLRQGRPAVCEIRVTDGDGGRRWLCFHSLPMEDNGRGELVRVIGAVQDVTDNKRMEQSLLRAERLAAMGRLAASLAHEINNPLQALHSGVEVLVDHPLDEDTRRRYMDVIRQEVKRLVAIVDQTLKIQRPPADRRELVNVNKVLDDVLLLVGKQLRDSDVLIQTQWAQDLPVVRCVDAQLKQVFLNIILNALDAMPNGGEIFLATGLHDEAREVWISFTDTGRGISESDMMHIFEPFYTTRLNGVGLGLTISYSIVERHGGRIEVFSEEGSGSTFTVFLPMDELESGGAKGYEQTFTHSNR